MRYGLILAAVVLVLPAMAAGPSTSCPSGYVAINQPYVSMADSTCPSGSSSAGSITSCLGSSPGGDCYMYAPTDVTYSDTKGAYRYSQICPLT